MAFSVRCAPVLLGFVGLGGCLGAGVFECQEDTQCGNSGICAPPGFCAFPDGKCQSGWQFGDYAGGGLAGECVDDPGNTGTGETGDTTDDTTTTGTDTTDTTGTTEPDTSTTSADDCGNGVVDPGEYCDGMVENGMCRSDCQTIQCDGNWGDCNDKAEDGCEAQLDLPSSCGGCDNVCDAKVCVGGECANLVFLTKSVYPAGQIGGIVGADQKCQAEADQAGLTGTYKAWLSVQQFMPASNFAASALPYARPDGLTIANDFADLLDGALDGPVLMTLDLDQPPVADTCPKSAWTNTSFDGKALAAQACGNFSGGNPGETGKTGYYEQTNGTWTSGCIELCVKSHPLYCVQQQN